VGSGASGAHAVDASAMLVRIAKDLFITGHFPKIGSALHF